MIGAGTMGLLHSIVLEENGILVSLFDQDDKETNDGNQISTLDQLSTVATPNGFDAIFCTRLGAAGIEASMNGIGRGGTIVLYQSLPHERPVVIDANRLHYNETNIVGSIAQTPKDVVRAIDFLSAHQAKLERLSVSIIPAEDATRAFTASLQPDVNRVLVDFRNFS